MREIIVSTSEEIFAKAKEKGMKEKYVLIRCEGCESHSNRTGYCCVWRVNTPPDGYCHRAKEGRSE